MIAPHPDDETLGCGGTMLKHVLAGDRLTWLIVTRAHTPQWSQQTIDLKQAEVEQVATAYPAEVVRLGLPTCQLDVIPRTELFDQLAQAIEEIRPEVVYVPHPGDVHTDHAAVFDSTLAVLKAWRMRALGVREILAYETLSETDAAPPLPGRGFLPVVYNDITGLIDRKLWIMGLYESERQSDPLPRGPSAIRAFARYRGAAVGVEHAEAFQPVREFRP